MEKFEYGTLEQMVWDTAIEMEGQLLQLSEHRKGWAGSRSKKSREISLELDKLHHELMHCINQVRDLSFDIAEEDE